MTLAGMRAENAEAVAALRAPGGADRLPDASTPTPPATACSRTA